MGKYDGMLLMELKAELRRRRKKQSGRKQELIERLEYFDRNEASDDVMEVEFHMHLPKFEDFKDLHSGTSIPDITCNRITSYFEAFDSHYNKEKSEHMYQERWIKHVRSASENGDFFIQALLRAEMKKKVSYKVDIQVTLEGVILEAQCECAVGQGPSAHCKHVQLLLHALNKFCESGNLITEVTCTQVLQTFHHCKPWNNSPMKVSQMTEMRGKTKFTFDPRPEKFRNQVSYRDHFRNTCINYMQTPCRIPVMQLFPPANIPAMYADHDYLHLRAEDQLFQDEGLVHISIKEREEIEQNTREQAESTRWKKERAKRITASKFGEICRATERKNKKALAQSITSKKGISTEATRWGIRQESSAVKKFEQVTGYKTEECGLFVSTELPYLAATSDRLVGSASILEVKCPFEISREVINNNVKYLLSDDEEGLKLKKTHPYYYQVQGQLLCTERQLCFFCVWTTKDIKILEIKRDEAFIQDMVSKLELFYEDYFKDALIDCHLYSHYNKYFG